MIKVNELTCCGCEACSNICPKKCIYIKEVNNFYFPIVDMEKCVNCGKCEDSCPLNKKNNEKKFEKVGYAGYLLNDEDRLNSTSGGVFFSLAKYVINNGGIVYGVVFDDNFAVRHFRGTTIDDIKRMQGSKYPQSRIYDSYSLVRKDLLEGKMVLFSGTPCQVNALYSFLGKKYSNLILVDIICHGVPSPVIWEKYIKDLCYNENIKNIVFKNKEFGWKKWNVLIETDKKIYKYEKLRNTYMSSYLCGYNVRQSCYECSFKGDNRMSDITIADGWGKPEEDVELNDGKGLSSIIINSQKGYDFINDNIHQFKIKSFSISDLVVGNPAYFKCVDKNVFRGKFMKDIHKKGVSSVLKKYSIFSLKGKIIYIINKISQRGEHKNE